jgi:hypothetical protein
MRMKLIARIALVFAAAGVAAPEVSDVPATVERLRAALRSA